MKTPIFLDFETEEILPRPDYPPKPVGVSIRWPGKKGKYWAWGHPTENNCSRLDGVREVCRAYNSDLPLAFHNAAFDLEVAFKAFNLTLPPWDRIEDTMFMAFLVNPYEPNYKLKELAERKFNLPPTERDELKEWILANVPEATKKEWAKWISKAPGGLVGRYADGDTERTYKLWKAYCTDITKLGLREPYDRERQLLPILMRNSREGICVDVERLSHDIPIYESIIGDVENQIRKRLKAPNLDLAKSAELADALESAGKIQDWVLTDKGSRSVAGEALDVMLDDKPLLTLLQYRAPMITSVNTFMKNWHRTATNGGNGRAFIGWNQIRNDADLGAKSGRVSSVPNFQNIPVAKRMGGLEKNIEKYKLITLAIKLTFLPRVRQYILPDSPDHVLIDRDFQAQEPRLLAHYEDGTLAAAYAADPWYDPHQAATEIILDSGLDIQGFFVKKFGDNLREAGKQLNLAQIYGLGVDSLALKLGISSELTRRVRKVYFAAVPGIEEMQKDMKQRARDGEPIRTIGGRVYFCEPPRVVKGRHRSYDYRLLNRLIQGGAADQTKQAIINYDREKDRGRLILQVHDELVVSVHKRYWKKEMSILKHSMEDNLPMDVPLLSEGAMGPNFNELEDLPRGQ